MKFKVQKIQKMQSINKLYILILILLFGVWNNISAYTVNLTRSDIQKSGTHKGDIVVETTHAKFILDDGGYEIDDGDDGGFKLYYRLARHSEHSATLSWEKMDPSGSYEIKVTSITFKAKAYTSNKFAEGSGRLSFNGGDTVAVGTNTLIPSHDFKSFGGADTYNNDVNIRMINVSSVTTFDYHFKDFQITYTIIPIIETKSEELALTVCDEETHFIDLDTCVTNRYDHFTYSYTWKDANNVTRYGNMFYSEAPGDYTVTVSVAPTACHEAKSADLTITVNPAALSLTPPTASDITYPATLASSTLTGGAAMIGSCEVEGTWAWQNSSTRPSVGDGQSFPVVFTPSENASYYTNFVTNATVNVLAYIFTGEGDDDDQANIWTKDDNWNVDNTPTIENVVIIRHNVIIEEEVSAYSVEIEDGYTLTIAPTGGLTVGAGGISGATSDNLILKAGTSGVEKGQTGYLRISPDYAGAMPEATVELFSVSYYDQAAGADNSAVWQGVGSPISEAGVLAKSVYTSCWVYSWDEATDGWVNNRATLKLTPFVGFSTTQKKEPEGRKYTYEGHLVSGAAPVTMDLAYTAGHGTNLLANSWAAPISIPNFESSDFVNAAHTIYILNAGTKAQSDAPAGGFTAPGKYIGVPIKTASELAASGYPVVIPSMQGFWVQAEGASAQLRLDYSRLVWGADYSGDGSNQPLRAPKHNAEASPVTGKMKVSISAGGWSDFIFLLESEKYMPEYEDGYDAIKIPSGGMDLFTVEGENYLGVDATNSIIGTRVGVRTSEETAYTLFFSHLKSESDMSLWDLEADQKIEINEGTTYTFFAEPNAEITDRFLIIERAGAPTNTTGVDDAEDEANVHKFIKDNQLYILKNGVLYNGTGARVK